MSFLFCNDHSNFNLYSMSLYLKCFKQCVYYVVAHYVNIISDFIEISLFLNDIISFIAQVLFVVFFILSIHCVNVACIIKVFILPILWFYRTSIVNSVLAGYILGQTGGPRKVNILKYFYIVELKAD